MKIKLPKEAELKIDQKVNTLILKAFNATSEDDPYERLNNVIELLKTTLKSELSDSWFKVDELQYENDSLNHNYKRLSEKIDKYAYELKEQKKDFLKMLHKAEKERDLYKERVINKG